MWKIDKEGLLTIFFDAVIKPVGLFARRSWITKTNCKVTVQLICLVVHSLCRLSVTAISNRPQSSGHR